MAAVPADVQGPSDAELIDAVRGGRIEAYGSLYERHVSAAYNLARQLSRSTAEADDLVSEAFARVLDTLRGGRGPDSAFRAYLLTALRHVAYDKTRRDRKLELAEDVTTVSGVDTEKVSQPFRDTAVAGLERSMAAKAFARLPERWQAVLWHTEIEGQQPVEVAPLLGLTPNGVSALAYRAREGLRQAYLQVHLAETTAGSCRATADKLGAWTRRGLSKRETAQVESHLDGCERCRALAAELADVNGGLHLVAVLVLGIGATGYLAVTAKAGSAIAAAAGATAATTATTAAGATTGSSGGAAAGAAGSLPRQFAGVGASVVALAAALALALTSSSTQSIPAAAPALQPPAKPAPAPPANPAPAPNPPAQHSPPQQPHPPTPNNPAPPNPAPGQPPAPAPPPVPGQPTLHATGPSTPITLVPGGAPVDVPITVNNTGAAMSQPVTATLNLPNGVTAQAPAQSAGQYGTHSRSQTPVGAGATPAHPASAPLATTPGSTTALASAPLALGRNGGSAVPATAALGGRETGPGAASAPLARAATSLGQVPCPGGSGTVTCTSPTGVPPGGSVVLLFRLSASQAATGGEITGTVSAGVSISVGISVRVEVPPLPDVDQLTLSARVGNDYSFWDLLGNDHAILDVTASNMGNNSKPITISVDRSGSYWAASPDVSCTGEGQSVTCVTDAPVAPGAAEHLRLSLYHLRPVQDTVTVTATLGSASKSVPVQVTPRCFIICVGPDGTVPGSGLNPTQKPIAPTAPPTTIPPITLPGIGTTTAPTTSTSPPPAPTTSAPPSPTTTTPTTGPTPPAPDPAPGCGGVPGPGKARPGMCGGQVG